MIRFVLRILIAAAGLWLAARIVPGVTADGWKTLIIAGFLLGVVNAVVRPVVTVLTFPLTLVTLGLFLLIVNAAMIGIVDWLLDGLRVPGLWAGVQVAVVTGIVSWIGQAFLSEQRTERE